MDNENVSDIFIDSIPEYERLVFAANTSIKHKGKSLDEWAEELSFPGLDNSISIDELESYSVYFINVSDKVMTELCHARAAFDFSKLNYARQIMDAKQKILEERAATGARAPGSEILDNLARNRVIDVYSTYKIAGLISDFWKLMHDKLRLVDSRLTSLSVMKNVESKYAIHN